MLISLPMPSGVEHIAPIETNALVIELISLPMPSGVEHSRLRNWRITCQF